MKFVRIKFEGAGLRDIKGKLEKKGWRNLEIGPYWRSPSGIDKTEDGLYLCWDLRGCPPDYDGPYENYRTTIAITLRKELLGKTIGIELREDALQQYL